MERSALARGGAKPLRDDAENFAAFLPLAFQTSAVKSPVQLMRRGTEIANRKKRQ
jgi:hypothetical protein